MKQKPFNLKEAKAGKPVCTRSGHKATIICFNVKEKDYPILALVDDKDGKLPYLYTEKGTWNKIDSPDSRDLCMRSTIEKEGWINIYKIPTKNSLFGGKIFPLLHEAMREAKTSEFELIDTVRIKWRE